MLDNPMKLEKQTIIDEITQYLDTDTLCFRSQEPAELFNMQSN